MRLLIIGPDLRDFRKVKNFTGIQAFYLARELRRRGVELHFIDNKNKNPLSYLASVEIPLCDHAIAFGLRWFTHQPEGCATIVGSRVAGAVTQLHDGLVHEHLEHFLTGVDCTFTFRDDSGRTKGWERYAKRYHYIGWAADPDYLYPEQRTDELRILIDHPYYKNGTPDITEGVTQDVVLFAKKGGWSHHYKGVRVRRLVNGGAEEVDLKHPMTKQFSRLHVPFEDIAREYRKTHIYMVTHKESVGLTCLELAYCGALVVASKGLIYQDRLDTIRHVSYDGVRAPWSTIMGSVNIRIAAEAAREQTWDKVADRMLAWFGSYK